MVPAVAEAATAFLDTRIAPSTRRSYTQTMTRLITGHGTAPVTALDGETLRELLTTSWDGDGFRPTRQPGCSAHGDRRPHTQHRLGSPPRDARLRQIP